MIANSENGVIEDFSEVEKHLRLSRWKTRVETLTAAAGSAIRLACAAGVIILALGAAVATVIFALSLGSKPEMVERVVTVDRYVPFKPTFVLDADPLDRSGVSAFMAREQERVAEETETGAAPALVNVVVFRNTPFQGGDWDWLTVGLRYDSVQSSAPDLQTCWVARSAGAEVGAESRVTLARKEADASPVPEDITPALAASTGTTVEILMAAQEMCVFD